MKKEPPYWDDAPTEPRSSVYAKEIRAGRVWRLGDFLDAVESEGAEVAENDRKLSEKINKLIRTGMISIREFKDQSRFFKNFEIYDDFESVWNLTEKSLSIQYAMEHIVKETPIKFIQDMRGQLTRNDISAIERMVKSGLSSENKIFRAQLRKENIANVVDEKIYRVVSTQLNRYRKTKSIILKIIEENDL